MRTKEVNFNQLPDNYIDWSHFVRCWSPFIDEWDYAELNVMGVKEHKARPFTIKWAFALKKALEETQAELETQQALVHSMLHPCCN